MLQLEHYRYVLCNSIEELPYNNIQGVVYSCISVVVITIEKYNLQYFNKRSVMVQYLTITGNKGLYHSLVIYT